MTNDNQACEVQSNPVQGGDGTLLRAALYHSRGREVRVVFPRSEQEFRECVASGTRTFMLTPEQVKEWDVQIDVREVPEGHSLELLFADDDEFYEALVFDNVDALGQQEPLETLPIVGEGEAGVGGASVPVNAVDKSQESDVG